MCPRYEFECHECYTEVELEMSITVYDPDKDYLCPYCGAKLRRVIKAANFILNGPGWFKDGY